MTQSPPASPPSFLPGVFQPEQLAQGQGAGIDTISGRAAPHMQWLLRRVVQKAGGLRWCPGGQQREPVTQTLPWDTAWGCPGYTTASQRTPVTLPSSQPGVMGSGKAQLPLRASALAEVTLLFPFNPRAQVTYKAFAVRSRSQGRSRWFPALTARVCRAPPVPSRDGNRLRGQTGCGCTRSVTRLSPHRDTATAPSVPSGCGMGTPGKPERRGARDQTRTPGCDKSATGCDRDLSSSGKEVETVGLAAQSPGIRGSSGPANGTGPPAAPQDQPAPRNLLPTSSFCN